jgi:Suppressor of fused protein (SUFU)
MADDADEELGREWYDRKSELMEELLGKEHDMVMHAIIPYAVGGALDLYYYPNELPGTAIATKELSELPGEGSSNDVFQCYELVMFTRHSIDLDAANDEETPFGRAHEAISSILNHIAPYSAQATLNPNETCEFPADMPRVGGRCLIFDEYPSYPEYERADFGLLAVIEVFRSEMKFARKNGGAKLLKRLRAKGHYPYSDLDRKPVV